MSLGGFRRCYGIAVKFFHLSFNDLTIARFVEGAQQLGFCDYIVLERQNWLRKVVSSVVGHKGGTFHCPSNVSAAVKRVFLNLDRVCIDRDEKPLLEYFDDWSNKFALLRRLLARERTLELSYERDIEASPVSAYLKCCEFLELEPFHPEVRLARTNPFPLRDLIVNWDEVQVALTGSPYEWMLEGVEGSANVT